MTRKTPLLYTALVLYAGLALSLSPFAMAQKSSNDAEPKDDVRFRIVINEVNPTTGMRSKEIANIFYKKQIRWSDWERDGEKMTVVPVDRESGVEVRKHFSKKVFGKGAAAIEFFWQRQIFSGDDVPPEKVSSDEAVLDFVRRNPGAIGYVSAEAELGNGVKELRITD